MYYALLVDDNLQRKKVKTPEGDAIRAQRHRRRRSGTIPDPEEGLLKHIPEVMARLVATAVIFSNDEEQIRYNQGIQTLA